MANTVLFSRINKRINEINASENSVIVLKGIPMSAVSPENEVANVENVIKNKLAYFMKIYGKRRFLTFEEFLMLNSFVLDQYEKVYILNNNLYMSQYPIDAFFSDEVKAGLLVHFSESENDFDETPIGNIEEIIDLYDGIEEYNGFLIGAYCEDKIPNDAKIVPINLFDYESEPAQMVSYSDSIDFIEITEESDYIELVKQVFQEPDELFVRTINYTGDLERLNERILDRVKLPVVHLLNAYILHLFRRVSLDYIAVLVKIEHGKKGGVSAYRGLHRGSGFFRAYFVLVESEHGEKVVHRRKRSIELVIDHIQLLRRQRMSFLHCSRVLRLG